MVEAEQPGRVGPLGINTINTIEPANVILLDVRRLRAWYHLKRLIGSEIEAYGKEKVEKNSPGESF